MVVGKIDVRAQKLEEEITAKFGFFPPFFEPALCSFDVLNNLWTQTNNSYLDNPLPAIFKEKLAAILGKYCAIPYCLVVHSCTLRPMGLTAKAVLDLLDMPKFQRSDKALCVERLRDLPTEMSWPKDTDIATTYLLDAAVILFNDTHAKEISTELSRVVGESNFGNLTLFLTYNYMCHRWVEAHPTLDYRLDKRTIDNLDVLLTEQPTLNNFFRSYEHHVEEETLERENEALDNELAHLFDTIPAAVCVLDDNLKLSRFNRRFGKQMGINRDDYDHPQFAEIAQKQLTSTRAIEDYDVTLVDTSGKGISFAVSSSLIHVDSRRYVVAVLVLRKDN